MSASPLERERLKRIVSDVVCRTLASQAEQPARAPASPPQPGSTRARWVEWGGSAKAAAAPKTAPQPAPPARDTKRTVALGADHSAVELKRQLARFLKEEMRLSVLEFGADSEEPVDYPDVARAVGEAVTAGQAGRGIVLDAMGVGSTMAANKVSGIRCALCHDAATARNAREHNDANVLALGSKVVSPGAARGLVRIFLSTAHAGGRHARRVAKIRQLEGAAASAPAPVSRTP